MSQSGSADPPSSGKSNILRASKLSNFGSSATTTSSPSARSTSSAVAATAASGAASAASQEASSPRKLFTGLKASKLAVVSGGGGGGLKPANPFASPAGAGGSTVGVVAAAPQAPNPFLRTGVVEEKPVCTPSAPNPFAKFGKATDKEDKAAEAPAPSSNNPFQPKLPKSSEGAAEDAKKIDDKTEGEEKEDEDKKCDQNTTTERDAKPELQEETHPETKVEADPPASSSFVFGQNLAGRAANFNEGSSPAAKSPTAVAPSAPGAAAAAGSFTFGQDLTARAEPPPDEGECEADNDEPAAVPEGESAEQQQPTAAAAAGKKTLSENAEDFMNHKSAQKRKYEEVEVTTGEENECNVIHTRAKLYFFENSNWVERGRGQLRLNDMTVEAASATATDGTKTLGNKINNKVSSSRIVMRTMGSLKVILNTKVYKGMSVEQPNEKSVRMTGMDESGAVKVFLVMCSPKDAGALYKALKSRLAELNRPAVQQPKCGAALPGANPENDTAPSSSSATALAGKRLKNASLSSEQDDDSRH